MSDPEKDPSRILIASMTSSDVDKEDVCLIHPGEHPKVKHKTCICYRPMRQTTVETLERLRQSGILDMQAPVGQEILQRIRRGAALSRVIDFEHVEILDDQGLLD
ncbi:MAG: hypothetical protein ACLQGP_05615 [Isosphaeraceae bacterium]